MQSKNKKQQTAQESAHAEKVSQLPCAVCGACGPSELHEMVQGFWFLVIPLCAMCHRDNIYGIHGQRQMWKAMKKTLESCLNETLRLILRGN